MTADVIGLKDEKGQACGTLNSGGTESILMAILAYREYKMRVEGVVKPNLVICSTGHVAAIKGCHYMDIEVRVIPIDKEFKMDIGSMKNQIDDQTIAVYASYPNYPYGTCDPIETIAAICHKKGVPVHLDMCLGGFVSPFIEDNWKIPTGITSISADPHKYGLSAKGVSVLLYSSDKYRKHQYFVTSYWPGGLYGTPGLSGSRSGVFIASAWISMMKLGFKGYRENARILKESIISII
jgi:sphinganine-1-phosphate aldolase